MTSGRLALAAVDDALQQVHGLAPLLGVDGRAVQHKVDVVTQSRRLRRTLAAKKQTNKGNPRITNDGACFL